MALFMENTGFLMLKKEKRSCENRPRVESGRQKARKLLGQRLVDFGDF